MMMEVGELTCGHDELSRLNQRLETALETHIKHKKKAQAHQARERIALMPDSRAKDDALVSHHEAYGELAVVETAEDQAVRWAEEEEGLHPLVSRDLYQERQRELRKLREECRLLRARGKRVVLHYHEPREEGSVQEQLRELPEEEEEAAAGGDHAVREGDLEDEAHYVKKVAYDALLQELVESREELGRVQLQLKNLHWRDGSEMSSPVFLKGGPSEATLKAALHQISEIGKLAVDHLPRGGALRGAATELNRRVGHMQEKLDWEDEEDAAVAAEIRAMKERKRAATAY